MIQTILIILTAIFFYSLFNLIHYAYNDKETATSQTEMESIDNIIDDALRSEGPSNNRIKSQN